MDQPKPMTYAAAGVDIDAANEAKADIKRLVRSTFNPQVLSDIGLFGGLFRFEQGGMKEPVLVSSADGVGTKLKVAIMAGIHNTVGYDLVSHCVNDILVQGARPLFFLDYIATGRLEPGVVSSVVEGLVAGCKNAGCVLIGGETAEMPDFYAPGDYDLAGFIVGVVDRSKLIDGRTIQAGDVVLGLPAAGLHTNGYSLARRIFFERLQLKHDQYVPELETSPSGELLKPHRCYLRNLWPALEADLIRGLAHITGGGLLENIPRILPAGCDVTIQLGTWPVPPVYPFMAKAGDVAQTEMYRVFNMGVGMVVIVHPANEARVSTMIRESGSDVYPIGMVTPGNQGVKLV